MSDDAEARLAELVAAHQDIEGAEHAARCVLAFYAVLASAGVPEDNAAALTSQWMDMAMGDDAALVVEGATDA
jgi:hypothetical protein